MEGQCFAFMLSRDVELHFAAHHQHTPSPRRATTADELPQLGPAGPAQQLFGRPCWVSLPAHPAPPP